MALNPKPVQTWCAILQTYSKKSRKELIGGLVLGFGLDEKEASDAVSSLPIVLVDGINLNQAKSVKEKLEAAGAEIEITNHDIIKKQCYRIEWPVQPSLAYFSSRQDSPLPGAALKAPTPLSDASKQLETKVPDVGSPDAKKAVAPLPVIPQRLARPKSDVPKPLPKKSWFPFGGSKEKKNEPAAKPTTPAAPRQLQYPTGKPKSSDADFQPKSPADLNQTEWQKRTQEIQARLEKMSSTHPESDIKREPVLNRPKPILNVNPVSETPAPVEAGKKDALSSNPPAESLPVNISEVAATQKLTPSLANQSHDLLEKIQKLEQELQGKKQSLEEKQAELEKRNQEIELKRRQAEEHQKLSATASEKAGQLEKALAEKHAELEKLNQEIEHKHQLVEESHKVGATFSEKVEHLQKTLTEKEQHLHAKHSELEQKSEKEKALSETVSQLEIRLAEKTAELETRKQESAQVNAQYEETLKTKDHELDLIQKRMQEIGQKFQLLEQGVYEKQDAIARKDDELRSKDQKIRDLQVRVADLEKKTQEAQSLEKDKEQQIANLNAREKELLKKVESLDKTLVEMGESLGQRDESLRQRDEVLVALERRVQDLAGKTSQYEAIKSDYSKLQEEFEAVSGKYNRLSEEYRRFRSKNERKTATLTREMGEWVRKVDHLRQGLQKFNQNIVRPELSEDADPDSDLPPSA